MDLTNSSTLSRLPGFDAHGVHIQDCFQNKSNKINLGDFFLLQTEQDFIHEVSYEEFQRKMMSQADKNRTISLSSKWECNHIASWLEWWRLDKK